MAKQTAVINAHYRRLSLGKKITRDFSHNQDNAVG